MTDLILKRPMPALGDYSVQHCDPARPATYVRGVGDRRRWEIALTLPTEDAAAVALTENVWERLSRFITPEDATLERAAVYTFHSTIARTNGALGGFCSQEIRPTRRLLFLGKACARAFETPPISDGSWPKVVKGAPEALLDTYQAERAPHVRENSSRSPCGSVG